MNTKSIEGSKTIRLPHLPKLTSHKMTKVVTKHFTNLSFYLPRPKLTMINWLVYEADANNVIKYSTELLKRFSATISEMENEYGKSYIPESIQLLRSDFKWLVEEGYLYNIGDKKFVISPLLSYSGREQKKNVDEFMRLIENTDHVEEIAKEYSLK